MAAVTISVNDVFVPRIVAALTFFYPAQMQGVGPAVGAKAVLIQFLIDSVANYEAMQAAGSADITNAKIAAIQQQQQTTYQNTHAQSSTESQAAIS